MSHVQEDKAWQQYGLGQGPNGARFDYLYDWMSKNTNTSHFEVNTVDIRWNNASSSGRENYLSPPFLAH
jgi:hypothetical protein